MTTPFVLDDGGRPVADAARSEAGDCSIRALAISRGIPYTEALKALSTIKGANGTDSEALVGYLNSQEWAKPVKDAVYFTVDGFCGLHPKGRYLVNVAHHSFAVLEGAIHDTGLPNVRLGVEQAWQVEKAIAVVAMPPPAVETKYPALKVSFDEWCALTGDGRWQLVKEQQQS